MNGAAMEWEQDPVSRSQQMCSSGLHGPGYLHPRPQQNLLPQHSKTMSYQSLSDHFVVDGSSENWQHENRFRVRVIAGGDVSDPRSYTSLVHAREPLELPVPPFEIDENYVGDPYIIMRIRNGQESNLDLDTRIDLLIKSKALAGMHPIFSELSKSDDSSDESFLEPHESNLEISKNNGSSPPIHQFLDHGKSDDPETPLSRPPSPFLSRATYLFWFNKAIELKHQAKAQEKALLEQATKRILHECSKPSKIEKFKQERRHSEDILWDEISKELKDFVKQELIREVLEVNAIGQLESLWEKERKCGEKENSSSENITESLHVNDIIISKNTFNDIHECKISEFDKASTPAIQMPGRKIDLKSNPITELGEKKRKKYKVTKNMVKAKHEMGAEHKLHFEKTNNINVEENVKKLQSESTNSKCIIPTEEDSNPNVNEMDMLSEGNKSITENTKINNCDVPVDFEDRNHSMRLILDIILSNVDKHIEKNCVDNTETLENKKLCDGNSYLNYEDVEVNNPETPMLVRSDASTPLATVSCEQLVLPVQKESGLPMQASLPDK